MKKNLVIVLLVLLVDITMYNPEVNQTDSTPFITASNKQVKTGYCATSRDLKKKYKLEYGDLVVIPMLNMCLEIQDIMNKRYTDRIDIFSFSKQEAIKFGVKKQIGVFIIRKKDMKKEMILLKNKQKEQQDKKWQR